MTHILIIVENLPVPVDRRVWQEALALRDAGYEITVICPALRGYAPGFERLDGIDIHRHPLPPEGGEGAWGFIREYGAALFWEFYLAIKIYCKKPFRAIHGCNPPDLIFLVALPFRLLGVNYVFDHHDINPELYESKFGKRGIFHTLLTFFEWLTFKVAKVTITTTETFAEIARTRGGVNAEDVFIVRSTPDLAKFQRRAPSTTLRAGKKLVFGYVGIIGAQDGVDMLIAALPFVRNQLGDDFRCVIVGTGSEMDKLEAQTKALGVDSLVIFTGYLKGDALLEAYSSFDIGVIPDPPNPYNHAIGMNKSFEYMALGIPFTQFALRESMRIGGDAALYVDGDTPEALAGGMVTLANDAERRARMGAVGLQRVQNQFNWDRERLNLLAAYRRVFGER